MKNLEQMQIKDSLKYVYLMKVAVCESCTILLTDFVASLHSTVCTILWSRGVLIHASRHLDQRQLTKPKQFVSKIVLLDM